MGRVRAASSTNESAKKKRKLVDGGPTEEDLAYYLRKHVLPGQIKPLEHLVIENRFTAEAILQYARRQDDLHVFDRKANEYGIGKPLNGFFPKQILGSWKKEVLMNAVPEAQLAESATTTTSDDAIDSPLDNASDFHKTLSPNSQNDYFDGSLPLPPQSTVEGNMSAELPPFIAVNSDTFDSLLTPLTS